jgi:hypothetical protein
METNQGTRLEPNQAVNLTFAELPALTTWADAFLRAKAAERLSPGTLHFYRVKLNNFLAWCDKRNLTNVGGVFCAYASRDAVLAQVLCSLPRMVAAGAMVGCAKSCGVRLSVPTFQNHHSLDVSSQLTTCAPVASPLASTRRRRTKKAAKP